MRLGIASDHAGFALKQGLFAWLTEQGHQVTDLGTHSEESCDYPDVAFGLGEAVARGDYPFGIVVCGSGQGVAMGANKIAGVRCALCNEPLSARLTRSHNDANMLALGGRLIGVDMAKAIVETFIATPFAGGRHQTRVDKLNARQTHKERA